MFDLIAPFYDRLLGGIGDVEPIVKHLKGNLLLDLGGGTGRVSQHLPENLTRVILDESFNMLRQAKAKGLPAVRGEGENMPFPDESFDSIIVVDSFHHFRDHRRILEECHRVLKPGGILIIREPNIERLPIKFVALFERLALMRSRFFSAGDIIAMAEGFGVETLETGTFFNLVLKKH